jgi:hypothetical protein
VLLNKGMNRSDPFSLERCADLLVFETANPGSIPAPKARKSAIFAEIVSCCVDVLELRSWRSPDLLAGLLLAAYIAIVAQPLVYGTTGMSIVALMTPVK